MENLHPLPGYDLEFYSMQAPGSTTKKDYGSHTTIHNNNNVVSSSPTAPPASAMMAGSTAAGSANHGLLNQPQTELGFAINVSTGESELFLDDLIALADDGNKASSAPMQPHQLKQPQKAVYARSAPPQRTLPYSRLHEALTQPPRLPTQPVKCHRCGNELSSRCLMQTCADDTRCRNCGKDLTAKCILAVCTVQPKVEPASDQNPPARRQRVHHYSSPSH